MTFVEQPKRGVSIIDAVKGEKTRAYPGMTVRAAYRTQVLASQHSTVIAQGGSLVLAGGGSHVIVEDACLILRMSGARIDDAHKALIINWADCRVDWPEIVTCDTEGKQVTFGDRKIILVGPYAPSVRAGKFCEIIASSGTAIEAGSNARILAGSKCSIKCGDDSWIRAGNDCIIDVGLDARLETGGHCNVNQVENERPQVNPEKKPFAKNFW